jgi:hypothetical protein
MIIRLWSCMSSLQVYYHKGRKQMPCRKNGHAAGWAFGRRYKKCEACDCYRTARKEEFPWCELSEILPAKLKN